ncbi:hypothetical protein NPIL_653381 [Nephila pilipes]|uniref:Uncharacterized protein n=1 Tax=Nephila pilipes TaxID=299642 RepID=A0A8X6NY53_NEPPI|nr:hypothetical protein NPIL_653381 [Nephila pilipes]
MSDCATGDNIRLMDMYSSDEETPDCVCDYAENGEQVSNITRGKTSHSANKYLKFTECNDQESPCGTRGKQSDFTSDPVYQHEQKISENQPKKNTYKQGRLDMDYPTPKHSRLNQIRSQNRPRRFNRAPHTSSQYQGQVPTLRSSDQIPYANHLPKPSVCYTADQKLENLEDIHQDYLTSIEKRRTTCSNTWRQRTETSNWRSRISRLYHIMGERLRKALSRLRKID